MPPPEEPDTAAREADRERQSLWPDEYARRHLPSYGPGWDAAIAFGIDVSMLLDNLALTPTERLEQMLAAARFHAELRTSRGAD